MCKSHLRLLWIVTPNTLWASTDSRALVSMAKADGRWSTTLRKRKVISLHFLGLRTILFVAAQVLTLSSSDCKIDTPRAAANSDIVMSSTYFQYEQRGEANFKSLIIITKSIGPSLVPWGTPARTGNQLESVCPSLTHGHQSVGKRQIHGMLERCTPKSISFLITMVWSILSNTLLKSRKRALK